MRRQTCYARHNKARGLLVPSRVFVVSNASAVDLCHGQHSGLEVCCCIGAMIQRMLYKSIVCCRPRARRDRVMCGIDNKARYSSRRESVPVYLGVDGRYRPRLSLNSSQALKKILISEMLEMSLTKLYVGSLGFYCFLIFRSFLCRFACKPAVSTFRVKQYSFHDVLHPLQHEAFLKRLRNIRAKSARWRG